MEKDTGRTHLLASPVCSNRWKPQAIVSGTTAVRGYDLETGEVIWHCGGPPTTWWPAPSSLMKFFMREQLQHSVHDGLEPQGSEGQLKEIPHELWTRRHRTPYVLPLFSTKSTFLPASLSSHPHARVGETGEEPNGPIRLPGILNLYASPVAADGRIYFTDQRGVTLVISWNKAPEILSLNRLNDSFNASAALVSDSIILRGKNPSIGWPNKKKADDPS